MEGHLPSNLFSQNGNSESALFWDNMYIAVYVQVAVFYKYDFEFTKWSTPSELIIYVIEFQIRPENEFEDIFFVTKLNVRARGLF